jgi:hypothetical protein
MQLILYRQVARVGVIPVRIDHLDCLTEKAVEFLPR